MSEPNGMLNKLAAKKEKDLGRLRAVTERAESAYIQFRDEHPVVPGPIRQSWVDSDRRIQRLRESFERIEADEDLTSEAKSRQAEDLYSRSREQIEQGRHELRESLQKAVKNRVRASYPTPAGEGLS